MSEKNVTPTSQEARLAGRKPSTTAHAAKRLQTRRLVFSWSLLAAILTLAFQTLPIQAQGVVQWVKVDGTTQHDSMTESALGSAGEIYLSGRFGHMGTHNPMEAVLFKYDSNGQQTTVQSWRGEFVNAVAVDAQGNYYLTGRVSDPDALGVGRAYDFYLAKYAANGTLLWERTAGTPRDSPRTYSQDGQAGWEIALDAAGNVYVAGRSLGPAVFESTTFPSTPGGPLLCKYAPDGTLLWVRRAEGKGLVFGGTQLGGGDASSIAVDADGNIVINGTMTKGSANFDSVIINITGTYDHGAFAAKYSSAGQIIWAKAISFGGVAVDRQGNTFISGPTSNGQAFFDGTSTPVSDPSGYKAFVAKFNPAGALLWTKAAPTGGLLADGQGNIYSGPAKLDPMGNLIWDRTVPGASLTVGSLNDRNEPVFTGTIKGTVNFDSHVVQSDADEYDDFVICKADAHGKFQWAVSVTSGNLEPRLAQGSISLGSIVSDRSGNILVSGNVNCPWSFAQQTDVCDAVGKFGDFPVSVQLGGKNDFFIARITDPAPVSVTLKASRTSAGLVLSWPTLVSGFVLESATALPTANWSAVPETPSVAGDQNVVTVTAGGGAKFYRLRKP